MRQLDLSSVNLSSKDVLKGLRLPKVLSPDLAYVCGILAGDGSIYTRASKHDFVIKCVSNPLDEKPLYDDVLSGLFLKLFGLCLTMKMQDSNTTYGFVVYSRGLLQFFHKVIGLPCGKKYAELCIPSLFSSDKTLLAAFIRGVADTDFALLLKRGSKKQPFYPVIAGSSKSKWFMQQISDELEKFSMKVTRYFDYVMKDSRVKNGYTIINRVEICGHKNFGIWMNTIGFSSPKHLNKVKKLKIAGSGFEPPTSTV